MSTPLPDPLAYYRAAVATAQLRLDTATSPIGYNLALADYHEARAVLAAVKESLGTTALAA